jgi:hypothetical protein
VEAEIGHFVTGQRPVDGNDLVVLILASLMPFFEISQFEQQGGNVISDDAPQGAVIDAKISVNHKVACRCRRTVEGNQDINVAVRLCRVACG